MSCIGQYKVVTGGKTLKSEERVCYVEERGSDSRESEIIGRKEMGRDDLALTP